MPALASPLKNGTLSWAGGQGRGRKGGWRLLPVSAIPVSARKALSAEPDSMGRKTLMLAASFPLSAIPHSLCTFLFIPLRREKRKVLEGFPEQRLGFLAFQGAH